MSDLADNISISAGRGSANRANYYKTGDFDYMMQHMLCRNLLRDYVRGDPQREGALRFGLTHVPPNARRILDVGAGIGWSTFEIHRHRDKASVLGIDSDPVLVETASRLFADPGRIEFRAAPFTAAGLDSSSAFDVVLLLHFYEHVPISARASLHDMLGRVLAPDGIVILASGRTRGKEYALSRGTRERQTFGEKVTEEEMRALARTLRGRLAVFQSATVSGSNSNSEECSYVVIARGRRATQSGTEAILNLPDAAERRRRIRQRLGLAISHGGYVLPQEAGPTVCVAYHSSADSAESFVLQHIESLPATVCTLIGAQPFEEVDDEGGPLVSRHPLVRALSAAKHVLGRRTHSERHRDVVARFLKRRGVMAVLAEFGPQALRVMYGCENAGVPLIAHFHGQDAYARRYVDGAENERRLRDLFRIARRIVVVSRDMQRQLGLLGAPVHKLRCNPCGVDVAAFAGARPAEASPRFVAVGRFVAKKAPYLTVLAFKRVHESLPEARLTMIGDGPLREMCVRLAEALGLGSQVSFPGAYPHRAVIGAMSQARAFVQHSLVAFDGDSEGTPVGILEAAASGLPVVSTRHAGIQEAVIHERTGILVDEGDWQAMAAGMLRLAQDAALAGRMGSAGRTHVVANYSMPARISSLWDIIREAITDR